jgi:hypothetical protein
MISRPARTWRVAPPSLSSTATARPDGEVVAAEAVLLGAVEIVVEAVTGGKTCLDEGVEERVLAARPAHRQLAGLPMELVAPLDMTLGPAEERQDVGIGPAGRSHLRPAVIVMAIAAHIDHAVDRRGAAERFATRPIDAPVIELRLGLGVVMPIVDPRMHELAHQHGQRDQRMAVRSARLDEKNLEIRIGRQPVGDHAPRRSGANDDVVEDRLRHPGLTRRPVRHPCR